LIVKKDRPQYMWQFPQGAWKEGETLRDVIHSHSSLFDFSFYFIFHSLIHWFIHWFIQFLSLLSFLFLSQCFEFRQQSEYGVKKLERKYMFTFLEMVLLVSIPILSLPNYNENSTLMALKYFLFSTLYSIDWNWTFSQFIHSLYAYTTTNPKMNEWKW
jgi:hypothetical protein